MHPASPRPIADPCAACRPLSSYGQPCSPPLTPSHGWPGGFPPFLTISGSLPPRKMPGSRLRDTRTAEAAVFRAFLFRRYPHQSQVAELLLLELGKRHKLLIRCMLGKRRASCRMPQYKVYRFCNIDAIGVRPARISRVSRRTGGASHCSVGNCSFASDELPYPARQVETSSSAVPKCRVAKTRQRESFAFAVFSRFPQAFFG